MQARWVEHFSSLSREALSALSKQLEKFTVRIEELEFGYRQECLQVCRDKKPRGKIKFSAEGVEVDALRQSIEAGTPYEEFIEKLFSYCWDRTEESLSSIRDDLGGLFLAQANSAIESLITYVDSRVDENLAVDFKDCVIRARTDFQTSIEGISNWFRRVENMDREPFEFELAIGVAIKQIQNCNVKVSTYLAQSVSVSSKVCGEYLDGVVEILFILIQNIIRHSGFGGVPAGSHIFVSQESSDITIEVINTLSEEIDLDARRAVVKEALERFESGVALRHASSEGGSGLSKVWRILKFDLKKKSRLQVLVGDDRIVRVKLVIEDMGLSNESLCS
jgi:hypothetical protein